MFFLTRPAYKKMTLLWRKFILIFAVRLQLRNVIMCSHYLPIWYSYFSVYIYCIITSWLFVNIQEKIIALRPDQFTLQFTCTIITYLQDIMILVHAMHYRCYDVYVAFLVIFFFLPLVNIGGKLQKIMQIFDFSVVGTKWYHSAY